MSGETEEAILLDAARYRWLRNQHWNESVLAVVLNPKESVKLGRDLPSLERLDKMTDTQMSISRTGDGDDMRNVG